MITAANVPSLKRRSILCGETQDTTAPQRCRTVQQQQQQTAIGAASRARDKPCGQQVRTVAPTATGSRIFCYYRPFVSLHSTQIKCWLSPCTTADSISTLRPACVPKVHDSQHKTQPLGSIVRKCNILLRVAVSSHVLHTFTVFLASPSNETS